MEAKLYRLRPHHINFLYGFILEGEETIRKKINEPYLSKLDQKNDSEQVEYDEETVNKVIEYCKEVVNNGDGWLETVENIDDICSFCNKRRESCEEDDEQNIITWMNDKFGIDKGEIHYLPSVIKQMGELKKYKLNNN
ncbi:MAG: hypothetical protein V1818_00650 [Candidatus Aenigmatarchaeota archaeon]